MGSKRINLESIGLSCTPSAIMNRVNTAIKNDSEPSHKVGEDLLITYERATPLEKEAIDKMFAFLCGYSFHTLVEQAAHGKSLSTKSSV